VVATALSPTGYVVLGLVGTRPSAGHELAAFAERSIASFFPVTRSHIYGELERLHVLGLLRATDVSQERYPDKRVYRISAKGDRALAQWLSEAAIKPARVRDELLVRIFFADRLAPGRLAELIDDFEIRTITRRDQLTEIVEKLADRPESQFRRATAMFGLRREEASLSWVDDVRALLDLPRPDGR
jgi:DNA-binding PadR family transcriptional regulator